MESNVVYLQTSDYDVAPSRNALHFRDQFNKNKTIVTDFGIWMPQKGIEDFCRSVNTSIAWLIECVIAIVLTHSHEDHAGMLPYIVRCGYRGPIYMTELCKSKCISNWLDDIGINARYGDFYYTEEDIKKTVKLIRCVHVGERIELYHDSSVTVTVEVIDNGHLSDAVSYFFTFKRYGCQDNNILLTGDLKEKSSIKNIVPIPLSIREKKMTILLESTYGDTIRVINNTFEREITRTYRNGGNVVIPCITNDRTAEVIDRLLKMQDRGLIPRNAKIYVKGKLGKKHFFELMGSNIDFKEDFNVKSTNIVFMDGDMFDVVPQGHFIMLVSPGMAQGGASLNAITHECSNPRNLVMFTSYVPPTGIASKFINARQGETIYIENHGYYQINATVRQYEGFSGHNDLMANERFLKQFKDATAVICNHGSKKAIESQCDAIETELGLKAYPASPDIAFRILPDGVKPIRHGAIVNGKAISVRKNSHPDIKNNPNGKQHHHKKTSKSHKGTRGRNYYKSSKRARR